MIQDSIDTVWIIDYFVCVVHPCTICPSKNGQKLNICVTIQYRIITVPLFGWPYLLLDLPSWWQVYIKRPLLRNQSNAPTPTPLQQHLLFSISTFNIFQEKLSAVSMQWSGLPRAQISGFGLPRVQSGWSLILCLPLCKNYRTEFCRNASKCPRTW